MLTDINIAVVSDILLTEILKHYINMLILELGLHKKDYIKNLQMLWNTSIKVGIHFYRMKRTFFIFE